MHIVRGTFLPIHVHKAHSYGRMYVVWASCVECGASANPRLPRYKHAWFFLPVRKELSSNSSTKAVVSRTHDLPQWYPFVPADTEMLARFRVSLKLDDGAAEASEEAAPAWAR